MTKSKLEKMVDTSCIRATIELGGFVTSLAGTIGAVGAGIYHAQTGQPLIGEDATKTALVVASVGQIGSALTSIAKAENSYGPYEGQQYPWAERVDMERWKGRITPSYVIDAIIIPVGAFGSAIYYGIGYGIGKLLS